MTAAIGAGGAARASSSDGVRGAASTSGPSSRSTRVRTVAPLALVAAAVLLAGLWGGLQRLGWWSSSRLGTAMEWHGTLMVLGFLGTLIALERAVALGRGWTYLAPALTGVGALATLFGAPIEIGGALLAAGGAVLVAAFVTIDRLQRALHTEVMAAGAVAWVASAVLLTLGSSVHRLVPLLAGFLVLTIAGERLELSRMTRPSRRRRGALLAAIGVFAAGAAASAVWPEVGVRTAGVGLVALAAWLVASDLARTTVRRAGVTRFMALSLLAGYAWLGVAGATWIAAPSAVGPTYDAQVHALFLGFVISMVFGHAPVIVPALLRIAPSFTPAAYGYLALLHASLLVRVVGGDVLGVASLRRWGGLANAVAILWFLGATVWSVVAARTAARHEAR